MGGLRRAFRAQDVMHRELQKALGELTCNTGLVASIFIGGPEPRNKGKIMSLQ